jgi:hypothetical protein
MPNQVYDNEDTLKDLEKPFHGSAAAGANSNKPINKAQGNPANDGNTANNTKANANSTKGLDGKQLANAENNAADIPYKPEPKKAKKPNRWWTNKKVGIAGGLAGLGVGTSFFGMTFLSGPLEFVHLANILHDSHFSQQEDAGDGRMSKLYRYLKNGKSAGETRLGFLGSKYHGKILAQLEEIGIKPTYTGADFYEGFTIDTESEKSPYKDMSVDEAAAKFEKDYGVKPEIEGKKIKVNATKFWAQKKSLKVALDHLGTGKVTTLVRARVLGKFGLVSWHPMTKLDKFAYKTTAAWTKAIKDKWKSRVSKGVDPPVTVDGSTAKSDQVDSNGNRAAATPEEQATASKAASDPKTSEKLLSDLKGGKVATSIAGGVAAVAGVVCALKAVNDNVSAIRYTQVILPMIRIGMDAMTVGSQIMSGQDVDLTELSVLSANFSKVTNGKTETWNDNTQIRAETHQDGNGVDSLKNDGTNDLLGQQSIPWLEWTDNPALSALCGTAGSIITGVVSVTIGILSGEAVSTVAGLLGGVVLGGPLIEKASNLLAGNAIDPTVGALAGPTYGGVADTGSLMGANAAVLHMGGTKLTTKEALELSNQVQTNSHQEFESQNFFARALNPMDYRSIVGHMADNISTSPMNNMSTLFSTVLDAGSSALSMPFNLYASTVHAESTYGYPVSTYGFSVADLANSTVANPYTNADDVAVMLDANGQNGNPDYIQKASDCFGVDISKGAEGWDVIPEKDINVYDTKAYDTTSCRDSTDKNWLKVRFFIFDTGIMEGYACSSFNDATSCTNDGFGNGAANAQASSDNIALLASSLLNNKNITLGATAKADLTATAANQQVTPGTPTKGTPASDCAPTFLDADLLRGLGVVAQTYKFTIDNLVSGHACDSGRHPMGRAADITELNGKPINWSGANLADDKQFATDVASIMAEQLPTGTFVAGQPVEMAGIGVCHQNDISPPPDGVNYYVDSCNKLVVDTGIAGS